MLILEQPTKADFLRNQPGVRLGSAVIIDAVGERVTVAFEGASVTARLALAFAYTPLPGDLVLVIVQEEAYVIGVLSGRGTTSLTAHGDLVLSAPHGRVLIEAGQKIEITTPQVEVQAQSITMTAVSLVQRMRSVFQSVTDLLHITAGQRHTQVVGVSMETTGRTYQRAEKEVVINGESVSIT